MKRWLIKNACILSAALAVTACGAEEDVAGPDPAETEAPLTSVDVLLEGAPDPEKIPNEPKSDQPMPATFDVVDTQSPVKSQGSRGVCSIFSTVALMEHLYIKEGSIPNPDFSEQFLQWSSKVELGAFQHTSGSNANKNVQTINRYGIVAESDLPYETFAWGTSHDERCGGDEGDRPVVCFTNGHPSDEVKNNARRWHLPRSRWVSNRRNSIKAHIYNKEEAVVAGMTFFYQSWNHRKSQLPTNRQYWAQGYVLYPNDKDQEISLEKRAGHSILLVGWDDNLEVPVVDENGEEVKDENGETVTEKGFFLFKNSWGTSGFGIDNPHGAGYGWLSMRYVERYANVVASGVPDVQLEEICDDGVDNTFNGMSDCADPACSSNPACRVQGDLIEGEVNPGLDIPDNDPAGASSTIDLEGEGVAQELIVAVDISHSYRGDLSIELTAPDGRSTVLHPADSTAQADLKTTFASSNLAGSPIAGAWTLKVIDGAPRDVGVLNTWSIGVTVAPEGGAEICDDGLDNDGNGQADCADAACGMAAHCGGEGGQLEGSSDRAIDIPDRDLAGITSTIEIAGEGTVASVEALVDITHTYRGDLKVTLIAPDGTEAVLHDKQGGNAQNLLETYTSDIFLGVEAAGTWTLEVVDTARGDTGLLNGWDLSITLQ